MTTGTLTWHNRHSADVGIKDQAVSDEQERDESWYDENWLTIEEAAERLGVKSRQAVYRHISLKNIEAREVTLDSRGLHKVLRINPESIDEYLNSR